MIRLIPPQLGSLHGLTCTLLILASGSALAGPFEIGVVPSRFEVSVRSGSRLGQSLDIQNVGTAPSEVSIRTIDWTYSEDGNVAYHDELLPGSCRPWVSLERKLVKLGAQEKKAFRFQIEAPADAPRGECRFMIAIEGTEPASKASLQNGGVGLSLPVSGRIGVAVYVAVNGAEPKLQVTRLDTQEINNIRMPVITVRNDGDAHGRLDGVLDAVGADGKALQLVPDATPILAGQTRKLTLIPKAEANTKPASPLFPLHLRGTLDWDNGSFKIDSELQ